ncbi:MAG: metallophosphoesterase [Bacillota bacterium]|nr:MAG: metallophosphoesterase [Bacillota bacterium]
MLRVGVVSDTHRRFGLVASMRAQCGQLDWLLHAGDHLTDAPRIAAELGVDPERVRAVAGNCDFLVTEPAELLLELGGVKVLLVHGHQYGVKSGPQRLLYRAKELGARVAVFGHSHVPFLEEVDGVLLLNPGSLSMPRWPQDRPSFAVLELADGAVRAYHVFLEGPAAIRF